jgi:hypothetical protein
MSQDERTTRELSVARMRIAAGGKAFASAAQADSGTRADSLIPQSLNKSPFPPIWSPVAIAPVGCIPIQVRQVIDRVQVSIRVSTGVLAAIREELARMEFSPRGEFTEAHPRSGKLKRKYRFEMDGAQVYLIRPENGDAAYWYRMQTCQPSPKVQSALLEVLSILPRLDDGKLPWYVSQIEVALDVKPVDDCYLDLVRMHIEHGLTIPRLRSPQEGRAGETNYYARGGDIRNGGHGFRVYLKPEDAPAEFVRFEAQLNSVRLKQLGLNGRRGLFLSPDEVNVFDYFQYIYPDKRRLETSLSAKFRGKMGQVRWWQAKILKGGSVACALDAFRKFGKTHPGLKIERIFLKSPKQEQLFDDLAQGFVRHRYRTRPSPS